MAAIKRFAEEVSVGLGYGGEINDHVMVVAQRFLDTGVATEDAESMADAVKDEAWGADNATPTTT